MLCSTLQLTARPQLLIIIFIIYKLVYFYYQINYFSRKNNTARALVVYVSTEPYYERGKATYEERSYKGETFKMLKVMNGKEIRERNTNKRLIICTDCSPIHQGTNKFCTC